MNLIVAVDKNWAIGNNGKLLTSLKGDMRYFKEMTTGKTVVMGRKTLESLPGGKPLKDRKNYVLSRNECYPAECDVLCSMGELFNKVDGDDVFVIGGEEIYRMLLPYCETAYITKIDKAFEADCYFPNLDDDSGWELVEEKEPVMENGISYRFCIYERVEK